MPEDSAIVIGGSVAGLVAARVLAKHFARVTLVERDGWPADRTQVRQGLPQAHHQHILLMRGRQVLEELFPGFDAELAALGAPQVDYTRDCLLVSAAGPLPRFPSGLELRLCRRPVIDWILRRRLLVLPGITFLTGRSALGLTARQGRVTGLVVAPAGTAGPRQTLQADLVVDASGRQSRLPEWLPQLGFSAPEREVVEPFLGYASRLYEQPLQAACDWKALEVASRPPHNPRAAGLWAVEDHRWLLTLIGTARDYPPVEEAGFLAFAQGLPDPRVHAWLRDAVPVSSIHGHRGTASRWHHYERLRRFPEGLVVLGDALCAFNPTHGQGMTVAALGAQVLDRHLVAGSGPDLARRVHAELAALVRPIWRLATSDDLRWPGTLGARPDWPMRLLHLYQDLATPASLTCPELAGTFLAVANLVKPPSALLRPRFLLRLLRQWLVQGRQP
jgi:flavin-dependent dehydrogenase